jgi:hypothetical protein
MLGTLVTATPYLTGLITGVVSPIIGHIALVAGRYA